MNTSDDEGTIRQFSFFETNRGNTARQAPTLQQGGTGACAAQTGWTGPPFSGVSNEFFVPAAGSSCFVGKPTNPGKSGG